MKAFLLAFKATIIGIAVFAKTFRYRANFSRGVVLFVFLLLSFSTFAQTPTTFNYQAVLRDASGGILANQQVEIGVTLLQGSVTGTEIFTETHSVTTNEFGLVNLQIGSINTVDMETIDWSSGPYFIQISVDGVIMGTSQLLSVPFAIHAVTVENDKVDDADADPGNELQVLSISNDTIYLSNGGKVKLPTETDPAFTYWDKSTGITITESQISDLNHFTNADETDPVFSTSQAASITATDISNLANLSGTNSGDQDLTGLLNKADVADSVIANQGNITISEAQISDLAHFTNADETDPVFSTSQAASITATDINNLANLSGTNTGDQDLTGLLKKADVADSVIANQGNITISEAQISDLNHFTNADETDPVFSASQASSITATDISNLANLSGTNSGDQDLTGLLKKADVADSVIANQGNITISEAQISDLNHFTNADETDPVFSTSQAASITATDISNLANLSGTNSGDQDLSALASKTALGDSTAQVRSEIPDVSGFLTSETDPIYRSSEAANISATDITNLGNLSGTNTGDQDISGITTNATAITAIETEQTTQNDAIALNTAKTGITTAQANAIVANTGKDTTGIYHANRTALDAVTGTNTGDQNLSSLATKTALGDSTAQVRSEIPDVSGFISAEEDPIYATDSTFLKSGVTAWDTSVAKTITAADTANWNNKVDTLIAGTGITISGDTIKATGSNSSTTYSVGDFAQGGVVFYVDETGQHGLVCAKTDQDGGSGISWYAGTYGNTQAKGDGPFAGEANTSIIIAAQVAIGDDGSTYAARICNELQITEGGKTYGDWYLPSKEELKLMYRNKAVIDATAGANGGSGFASHYYYWSSTEFDDYAAWELSFNVGYPSTSYKVTPERVRAVRAF